MANVFRSHPSLLAVGLFLLGTAEILGASSPPVDQQNNVKPRECACAQKAQKPLWSKALRGVLIVYHDNVVMKMEADAAHYLVFKLYL